MSDSGSDIKGDWVKRARAITVVALTLVLPLLIIESPVAARVVAIGGVCLALWLLELVPPFVPTLLLWVLVPLFLSRLRVTEYPPLNYCLDGSACKL